MKYNHDYISLKYKLLNTLMVNVSKNVLDISYNNSMSKIIIQTVLIKGTVLEDEVKMKIFDILPEYEVVLKEIYLTKEQFNENIGDWSPKYYEWLDNLLFCKAEVI